MRPAIFDMDIGSDPDASFVAVMVARAPERYRPVLMLTNDEAESRGRARFLAHLMAGSGVPVASGRPSLRLRKTALIERLGLPGSDDFDADGVAALARTVAAHDQVDYFGLGALTNLAEMLRLRPELGARIHLHQMGPALARDYPRSTAQFNARIDPVGFRYAVTRVPCPDFLLSHVSRAKHPDHGRQELGVYLGGPIAQALRAGDPVQWLLAAHLEGWVASGKPCSILHDPLTVLAQQLPLVDWEDTELVLDDEGFADRPPGSRPGMTDPPTAVRLALRADYPAARRAITDALFGGALDTGALAEAWARYDTRA